jgi:hypothetical protein
MTAEEARNISNQSKTISYISRAALQGKGSVDIPKGYVDTVRLENQGYKVTESDNQENYTVSWRRHSQD